LKHIFLKQQHHILKLNI